MTDNPESSEGGPAGPGPTAVSLYSLLATPCPDIDGLGRETVNTRTKETVDNDREALGGSTILGRR